MKIGLAFLLSLVISTSLQANESSWLTNYGDALKLAQTTARPLLLIISRDGLSPTAGDRSSPGTTPQLSRDFLSAYVLCKIDANSGHGKSVAAAFRITEFPHALIIDKTTKKILYSQAGQGTAAAWKVTLAKYQGQTARPGQATHQVQATYRSPAAHQVQRVVETPPQATFWSPPRANGRAYFFRQPANCNT